MNWSPRSSYIVTSPRFYDQFAHGLFVFVARFDVGGWFEEEMRHSRKSGDCEREILTLRLFGEEEKGACMRDPFKVYPAAHRRASRRRGVRAA